MAKMVRKYRLKGDYDHETKMIAEYNPKTEETTHYSLDEILAEFDQKTIAVYIAEESEVPSVEQ